MHSPCAATDRARHEEYEIEEGEGAAWSHKPLMPHQELYVHSLSSCNVQAETQRCATDTVQGKADVQSVLTVMSSPVSTRQLTNRCERV